MNPVTQDEGWMEVSISSSAIIDAITLLDYALCILEPGRNNPSPSPWRQGELLKPVSYAKECTGTKDFGWDRRGTSNEALMWESAGRTQLSSHQPCGEIRDVVPVVDTSPPIIYLLRQKEIQRQKLQEKQKKQKYGAKIMKKIEFVNKNDVEVERIINVNPSTMLIVGLVSPPFLPCVDMQQEYVSESNKELELIPCSENICPSVFSSANTCILADNILLSKFMICTKQSSLVRTLTEV
ncbi:hypothetical protein PR048_020074 [Dryococelus australis]|uniref:Uncharacterized protein n=1 Tax=Dryococelus australis TaxID=614101 RepID=A0ABQ9H592_9NEOP|nr:hypothetical protein PR048_020074 [Dryococelus australis]